VARPLLELGERTGVEGDLAIGPRSGGLHSGRGPARLISFRNKQIFSN
jgi:hypothetical protein